MALPSVPRALRTPAAFSLARLRAWMKEAGYGAVVLFDYLNVHRELENLVQRETLDTPMGAVQIRRWFDGLERSFNKRITIGEKRYLERVRGYDLDEISAMFNECGLTIREAFGGFDGDVHGREFS